MSEKRYAIVRCNYNNCPIKYKIPKTYKNRCILNNENCEQCGRNGDTKEQFINKVAQVLYKKELEHWSSIMLLRIEDVSEYVKTNFKAQAIELAKEIVEFLGVEE